MGDLCAFNVRYGAQESKARPRSTEIREFKRRIDTVSTKFTEYQEDVSEMFGMVLADKPSKARLTAKLTRDTVRWSCVHETQEILTLAISALAVIKANVSETTIRDYKQIVSCLDETASKQYARLMLSENKGLWGSFCDQLKNQFSSLQAWAESNPKAYKGIKCGVGALGVFAVGGGLAALIAHFLPASVCALGGPVFVVGGLIALALGACGLGLAYYMQQQKQKKEVFNGALLKMIQDLSKDMTGSPDLSEVLKLLKATREQASTKWGGLLSEHQQELLPQIGECSICLGPLNTEQDLVVPITDVKECMDAHVFHSQCIPEQGACPLCRRNYLAHKHLELKEPRDEPQDG